MYQGKNSKTAAKKEMEIFRELVGVDEDIKETAMALKKLANERLVIKRSNKAKPILEGYAHTIKGKSTSYDVYL
jgi:16S rRNA (guanine1516-N2)-methyltransferase